VIELSGDDVVGRGATRISFVTHGLGISERSLLISCAGTRDGGLHLLFARVSSSGCEARAGGKGDLRRRGAGQATRLAPAEKAVGLAVLGAVLARRSVALGARRGDANGGGEAAVELVVIELSGDDVVGRGATRISFVTHGLGISKRSLLISGAGTRDGGLHLLG